MNRIKTFVLDVWNNSRPRIERADPLLMGAAIAYNTLFAMVPLAVAFVAILSLFDRSGEVLTEIDQALTENLPADAASFFMEILQESSEFVQNKGGMILVISILIALWSGSRAVYAMQKALRTAEGVEDTRGYLRTRLFGIALTVASGVALLIGYAFFVLGELIWTEVTSWLGGNGTVAAQVALVVVAIAWVWLLLWAVYRWGPPVPLRHSGIFAAAVAALLVIGSMLAVELLPAQQTTLSVFGALGVLLGWLYYFGVVVVGAPTVLNGIWEAVTNPSSS